MTKQKGVFVDFSRYPDLYEALKTLATEEVTAPPTIIRQMVKEGIETRKHLQVIRQKVQKEIQRVAK